MLYSEPSHRYHIYLCIIIQSYINCTVSVILSIIKRFPETLHLMLYLDNSALALTLAPPPPGVAGVQGDRQQHGAHYGAHHADHNVPDQLLSRAYNQGSQSLKMGAGAPPGLNPLLAKQAVTHGK